MAEEGDSGTALDSLKPSAFMRQLRPECYSDTTDRVAYVLDASLLEYQLSSITARNETHGFEIFCRKLCERTICPNLRPQTGPEGGGDSKADADTFPVADEIATLSYVGEANAGQEKWAFAFSAKAAWSQKVRDDVDGLVKTGRACDRIYFVTSRPARARDRARIEKELTEQHAVPVVILDQSWIVSEVIDHDRKDIAFNYLGVGQIASDPLRLGPEDYSRTQQLVEIERAIEDPAAFSGMESQRVTEALVAAKLSRNMERPRVETDGRFQRAIRLADQDGLYRQQLEARYEHIWTSYWWFDDIALVNQSYAGFEEFALEAGHARNLEFLVNLLQLHFNAVIHGYLTRNEAQIDRRVEALRGALEPMAADRERPNNRLEAQTSLTVIAMNMAKLDDNRGGLSQIWESFSSILDEAAGMGEFDAKRLVTMIEVAGGVAGNDPAYNDLIEKVANFVANRTGEAQAAQILLKRAQQLGFCDKFDMIRMLGKAAAKLTKKEHAEQLIEAQQLLSIAYRSAGLLWASRATCVFVAASIVIEGEEDSQLSVSFVPTMKLFAWITLELGLLPDFLLAVQLLNGASAGLPLDDDSKAKVKSDTRELDFAIGSRFLNATDDEARELEKLPALLEALGFFASRTALLYTLGYQDVLRGDGSIPSQESDEDVARQMSMLASQPVARQIASRLLLNSGHEQVSTTTILGMNVEVTSPTTDASLMVAQVVLGSLEAFFATIIERRVVPHTECFCISIYEIDDTEAPSFEVDELRMTAVLSWPSGQSPGSFRQQETIQRFLMEMTGKVLAAAFLISDIKELLQSLYVDEAVQGRIAMILAACTAYHRLADRNVSHLDNWPDHIGTTYALRLPRPTLERIEFPEAAEEKEDEQESAHRSTPDNHRTFGVRSVIDVHAWNRAKWRGAGYFQFKPDYPPVLALLFENREGARSIFERWVERVGDVDERDEINLSLIRDIFPQNPFHYAIQISSRLPDTDDLQPGQPFVTATRSLVMEPANDTNLEMFLAAYRRIGAYYLIPGILTDADPDFIWELKIIKRALTIKSAPNIEEHDIEHVALQMIHAREEGET